jgi:hypothetical protein
MESLFSVSGVHWNKEPQRIEDEDENGDEIKRI